MFGNRFTEQLRDRWSGTPAPRLVEIRRFELEGLQYLARSEVEDSAQSDFGKVSDHRLLTSPEICPLSRVLEACSRFIPGELNALDSGWVVAIRFDKQRMELHSLHIGKIKNPASFSVSRVWKNPVLLFSRHARNRGPLRIRIPIR